MKAKEGPKSNAFSKHTGLGGGVKRMLRITWLELLTLLSNEFQRTYEQFTPSHTVNKQPSLDSNVSPLTPNLMGIRELTGNYPGITIP